MDKASHQQAYADTTPCSPPIPTREARLRIRQRITRYAASPVKLCQREMCADRERGADFLIERTEDERDRENAGGRQQREAAGRPMPSVEHSQRQQQDERRCVGEDSMEDVGEFLADVGGQKERHDHRRD